MAIDFPNSPAVNALYTAGGKTWQWNGTYWAAYGTGPVLRTSDTAPVSPNAGDLWYETDTGRFFTYIDSAWVEIGNATDIAGALQPSQMTALSAVTTLTSDDIFPVVDGPSSAVASSKITADNLASQLAQFAPQTSFRNAIINGDFRVNQRAFTSITASDTYGFDRWAFQASGGTSTMTPQTFTVGSPAATGYESEKFCRLVTSGQSGVNDYSILYQKIEDVRTFANSTVTISFWAKAASGTPKIAVEFGQVFGTGGSPSSGVNTYAGQSTISTSWARYSITATVPSISGKTIGTTANTSLLGINFWVSGGSTFNSRTGSIGIQNNTFDIWGVQVERGSVATPFEQRPQQTELALCQRYYYRFIDGTGQPIGLGVYTFTTLVAFYIIFPVTMRIAPVLVSSTGTNYYVAVQGFTTDYFNSVTTSQMSNKVAYIYNGTEVSASAGAVYGIYSNDTNASIAFNAEL